MVILERRVQQLLLIANGKEGIDGGKIVGATPGVKTMENLNATPFVLVPFIFLHNLSKHFLWAFFL